MIGINAGSGQRKFDASKGWINIDINPKWEPGIVGDWNDLSRWADGTIDYVVSHHSIEHVGCGEAAPFIKEAYRVLKEGGSLLVFVPDMRALAQRWMLGQITTQIFMTNVYGAYMNDEADRHRWGYDVESLKDCVGWHGWEWMKPFNWRPIEGADIARDWWILGIECVK